MKKIDIGRLEACAEYNPSGPAAQLLATLRAPVTFVVRAGYYTTEPPQACPKCGATDGISCTPGEWPRCWRCGVTVLRWGRTPTAPCVTPNGRVDGHMSYVKTDSRGRMTCAFCGEEAK